MTRPAAGARLDPAAVDPLALLERDDKWFLGGAPALLYAPPAPVWEAFPGFWDGVQYLNYALEPAFTFGLVDEEGRDLPLAAGARRWWPHLLERRHLGAGGEVEVIERRTCGPGDLLADVVTVRNRGARPRRLQLLAWTAQPVEEAAWGETGRRGDALVIERPAAGLRGTRRPLALALQLEGARSWSLDLAEPVPLQPHRYLTPYSETLTPAGLPDRASLGGVTRDGLVFAALERQLELPPGGEAVATIRAAVALDAAAAAAVLASAADRDPLLESERAWREHFAGVPRFASDDPYLQTAYWYRWYGLRLNALRAEIGNYRHPAVAEGIGYFRAPISYSAQAHMLETRWMHDPALARGSFRTFADNQRADGSLPDRVLADWVAPEGIYHADWGARVLDVHRVHPERAFLEEAYAALGRYLGYFYRERDPQGSGLYDHVNQWESGQEYMSRYLWVDDEGDHWKAMRRRLKGIDASVYVYRCERAMARLCELLGRDGAELWTERAERTGRAIRERAWRDDLQAFVDLSPELEPSGLVFALSFYPFFTDLVRPEHLPSIRRWLLDPDQFWTRWPAPASPRSDPRFSATPEWRGKRTNCPWNGRTWPMTNSHLVEALAGASELDPELRAAAAELLRRTVWMMTFDGDPARPNAFEHYNPETGAPSRYRGFDDYMHSWIVDLIIKYVAGVRPGDDRVVIDPFPLGVRFAVDRVRVRGREFAVRSDEDGFAVRVDGREVHRSAAPERLEVPLPAEDA